MTVQTTSLGPGTKKDGCFRRLYELEISMFLSRNYRLIVAPRKFDVLKQIFAREAKKYASFKNIQFPRGNYQIDSSET